ncbi:helix-turn-helix transcriptional regulator [Paenibacillus durus]|uniref:Transcriptional regulator n=1 Tax=Paenibacillus durus ATCC 35681 TaxID=1333534 RepID=A0A0F7F6D4_PAEDU|nr:metalloregulator ArsR/SmtB family transcription factor [Paenibacillus durus]AKG33303.1 transcriptional regulator [Paenibacillus durus ATCC 35681]
MSKKDQESITSTRKKIVTLLKQHGPMDAVSLASKLSLTGMAVRQHLYELQNQQVVEFEEEARPMGRPAKMWKLTSGANAWFPNGYLQLSVSLLHGIRASFGEDGVEKILDDLHQTQKQHYHMSISDETELQDKLQRLSMLRMNEGYFAEVQEQDDESFLLIQKHCPILEAADACRGFCRNEIELFQSVLGDNVVIERVEYLLSGEGRCTYRITERKQAVIG